MADNCSEKFDFEFIKWIIIDGRSREKKKQYVETIRKYNQKFVLLRNKKETASFLKRIQEGVRFKIIIRQNSV
jgi:hypothetical protein